MMDGDCPVEAAHISSKWAPAGLVDGVGVLGGFLKKLAFVICERVGGEAFLKVAKRESWVCHSAAGKAAGCNPLARCMLFDDMASLVQCAAAAAPLEGPPLSADQQDSMAGFGLDEDLPAPAPPKNVTRAAKAKLGPQVVEVLLPPRLRGSGNQLSVRCLAGKLRAGAGFYIHTDALGWVIEILSRQVLGGGVEFVPPETKLSEPFFATRDACWVARARGPDGEPVRRSLRVPRVSTAEGLKRTLSTAEYKELKRCKLGEIKEWQASVPTQQKPKENQTHTKNNTQQ